MKRGDLKMFDNSIVEGMTKSLLGVYQENPEILRERQECIALYNFYKGETLDEITLVEEKFRGQNWVTGDNLKFRPTKDIRNHTKKLINKQARFMLSKSPTLTFKPKIKSGEDGIKEFKEKAEKRTEFINDILANAEFWEEALVAFREQTITKRVLMVVEANPKEEIGVKFFTMDKFTYKVTDNSYKELKEVIICYLEDEAMADKPSKEQVYIRIKYYMKNEKCWREYGRYDGEAKLIKGTDENTDTGFSELPCRVVSNSPDLGSLEGTSDVSDLRTVSMNYNKTVSDFRDALRFRMFAQPYSVDASGESLENMKIAPNGFIDIQTDDTLMGEQGMTGQAQLGVLEYSSSFADATEKYLDRALKDLYELMDQPRPEEIKIAKSGKAMKFIFFELIARCDEKWKTWDSATRWLIGFIEEAIKTLNLYVDDERRDEILGESSLIIIHNYPIPEDIDEKKDMALKEVEADVKSRKSYIKEHSDDLDYESEFNEILSEKRSINEVDADSFNAGLGKEVADNKKELDDLEEE